MDKNEMNYVIQRAQAAVKCYDNRYGSCKSCIYANTTFCDEFRSVDADILICVIADLLEVVEEYEIAYSKLGGDTV